MAFKNAKDMVSRALALARPTLRVNRLLVKALPRVDAEQHLVLLLSCTKSVLEVAIAEGHPGSEPFALSLPRNQEFQVNLAKTLISTLNLTPVEIVRLRVEVKRHPRSVIEAAIAEHYPQPLEQQTSHEVARVLEREYAETHGILLVRVQGQVLLAYYQTAAGRRKLEDLVEGKEFRGKVADVAGFTEGHRRHQFLAGLVGDFRKVTRDFFEMELAKAYPLSAAAALAAPEQQLRGPIERANLEHTRTQPVAALPLQPDSDVRTIINTLFRAAAQQRASDLKIKYDFKRKRLMYSMYLDYGWTEWFETPPMEPAVAASIINTLRNDAGVVDSDNNRWPHEDGAGEKQIVFNDRMATVDYRVALIPQTQKGDKRSRFQYATFRLYYDDAEIRTLDKTGMFPFQIRQAQQAARNPNGLILCAGPTGSGKSDLMRSLALYLHELLGDAIHFHSVEDPVEVYIDWILQTEIPRFKITVDGVKRELEPTDIMAGLMRSHPQVILMGEVRDQRSCDFAFEAGVCGALGMASVHARSPFAVMERVLKWGIDRLKFAETVQAVFYQRLLPRLCPYCALDDPFEDVLGRYPGLRTLMKAWLDLPEGVDVAAHLAAQFQPKKANPAGCPRCRRGYKGRVGIFELWLPGRQRHLICAGASAGAIREDAINRKSHWTHLHVGLLHILQQTIDFDGLMAVSSEIDTEFEGVGPDEADIPKVDFRQEWAAATPPPVSGEPGDPDDEILETEIVS